MFGLLCLINITSFIAFGVGLISPKLVLRGEKRTRRKSSEVYLSAFVLSFVGMIVFVPKPQPAVVIAPATKLKTEVQLAPAQEVKLPAADVAKQEVKPSPISTPKQQVTPTPTPIETPAFVAFDPSVCNTDAYLPINGASIALYTTCQYIKTDLIKPESVSVVTGANGDSNPSVLELQAESGFEKVMWRDYTIAPESGKDVCVNYKDKSVSCLAFSNPDETAEVQDQPQVTTNIPTGSKCDSFATQEEAQKALPSNPQLDRDGNGTACDSLVSGGSGSSHSYTVRRRRKK
ncbi:hypothetical protein [Nostoc sp. ChiSLP03a]|uniref:hypothetical protein n=1 Tax=Nostoc sp. ChiSLP03a TaxID=3075380 RepID=UPI002AD46555|nr:hypothetical protein [Nostoc sp. ChiSLP03a]MDZ8211902.1 hypothetical protein [Nostoc sp. ChiSLP03a]